MSLSAIAVIDRNQAIGKDGQQLCYIPADLQYFKQTTQGHTVIYGRKTLYTFPGQKPLARRRNIILSRNPDFACPGATVCRSRAQLLALLADMPGEHFVIGGASVYRLLASDVDRLYLTQIFHRFPAADTYFFRQGDWTCTQASEIQTDPATGLRFQFLICDRPKTQKPAD